MFLCIVIRRLGLHHCSKEASNYNILYLSFPTSKESTAMSSWEQSTNALDRSNIRDPTPITSYSCLQIQHGLHMKKQPFKNFQALPALAILLSQPTNDYTSELHKNALQAQKISHMHKSQTTYLLIVQYPRYLQM